MESGQKEGGAIRAESLVLLKEDSEKRCQESKIVWRLAHYELYAIVTGASKMI